MRHHLLAGISLAALLAWAPSASAAPFPFDFTGMVQTFTVPMTGACQILAFGAQGGSGGATGAGGGLGAEIGGDFSLTAGAMLGIYVGGAGGSYNLGGGGGGRYNGGGEGMTGTAGADGAT